LRAAGGKVRRKVEGRAGFAARGCSYDREDFGLIPTALQREEGRLLPGLLSAETFSGSLIQYNLVAGLYWKAVKRDIWHAGKKLPRLDFFCLFDALASQSADFQFIAS
jgi:hypothetical protein